MDGLSRCQSCRKCEDKKSTSLSRAYGDMSNIRTAMNAAPFDFLTSRSHFGDLENETIDKTIATSKMMRRGPPPSGRSRGRARLAVAVFSPQIASRLAPSATATVWKCIGAMLRPFSPILPVFNVAGGTAASEVLVRALLTICRRR